MTNKEIAHQFSLLSKLMDIHGENEFKIKSYANAAFALDKLPFEIEEAGIEAIEGQRGFGKSIVTQILEIMDEEELPALRDILEHTPAGVVELLNIKGIGPKKIHQLWRELDIDSPGALLYACNENRLVALKGFGAKSQASIQEKLEFYFASSKKLLWAQAEAIIEQIKGMLAHLFIADDVQFDILGDYYWQKEIVHTIDVIINQDVKSNLPAEWSLEAEDGTTYTYLFQDKLYFRFHCVSKEAYATQRFLLSFSEEIQSKIEKEKISGIREEQVQFEALGMAPLPPYLRDNAKAYDQAKEGVLPKVIELSDIKGVIHNHSHWSDGANTIEEMARGCMARGYAYFVLSDHSQTSFYANGLQPERIRAQHAEIDAVNQKVAPFRIFKSIECDILGDGRLDYEDDLLETMDIVICSVHQNLNMTEEKAMARLLAAIENPYTSILGHATGRLLLTRAGYPIDHRKIIDACAANEVVLEINANPRRLDLDWRWIDYALEKEVLLSINPDAHRISGIDDIRYGVLVAQKAMLPPAMNLSSFSLAEFEDFLMRQHAKR